MSIWTRRRRLSNNCKNDAGFFRREERQKKYGWAVSLPEDKTICICGWQSPVCNSALISLATASSQTLAKAWATAVDSASPERRRWLAVRKRLAKSTCVCPVLVISGTKKKTRHTARSHSGFSQSRVIRRKLAARQHSAHGAPPPCDNFSTFACDRNFPVCLEKHDAPRHVPSRSFVISASSAYSRPVHNQPRVQSAVLVLGKYC